MTARGVGTQGRPAAGHCSAASAALPAVVARSGLPLESHLPDSGLPGELQGRSGPVCCLRPVERCGTGGSHGVWG